MTKVNKSYCDKTKNSNCDKTNIQMTASESQVIFIVMYDCLTVIYCLELCFSFLYLLFSIYFLRCLEQVADADIMEGVCAAYL